MRAPRTNPPAQFDESRCNNCGTTLSGAYCSSCGQRRVSRLDAWRVARDALAQAFDLEGPWLRTLRDMTLRPSVALRDFVAGARKRYVNPVLYLIAAGTALLLTIRSLDVDLLGAQGFTEAARANYESVLSTLGYLGVFAALPAAWMLGPLWRGHTVGERYVVLVFTYAQLAWFNATLYLLGMHHLPGWFVVYRLASLVWFALVIAGFVQRGSWRGAGLGALAYLVLTLNLIATGSVLIALRNAVLSLG